MGTWGEWGRGGDKWGHDGEWVGLWGQMGTWEWGHVGAQWGHIRGCGGPVGAVSGGRERSWGLGEKSQGLECSGGGCGKGGSATKLLESGGGLRGGGFQLRLKGSCWGGGVLGSLGGAGTPHLNPMLPPNPPAQPRSHEQIPEGTGPWCSHCPAGNPPARDIPDTTPPSWGHPRPSSPPWGHPRPQLWGHPGPHPRAAGCGRGSAHAGAGRLTSSVLAP